MKLKKIVLDFARTINYSSTKRSAWRSTLFQQKTAFYSGFSKIGLTRFVKTKELALRTTTNIPQNIVYHVLSLFFLIFITLYPIPHTLHPTFAQESTPSATPSAQVNYQPINVNSITPQSPMYANLMVNNLLHAFSCLMAGASPIGQPCIDYLNGVPVISQADTSGGLLGVVANLNTIVIANPPIRTGQYLATIGDSLGITKEAHAQVGGSGAGVLKPILKLWQVSRNIAYIVMIIIFVIIGLMVMFRQRINPQTVITAQAALPGLVIGLILITFSYFLASLLTDTAYLATNLVGYYFQVAQSEDSTIKTESLIEKTKDQNVLSVMGNLMNGIHQEDIAKGLSSFFDNLVDPAARLVRLAVAFAAYQFGSSVGPAIGATVAGGTCGTATLLPASVIATPGAGWIAALVAAAACAPVGQALGGLSGGALFAVMALRDPPGIAGLAFWFIAMAIIVYQMAKLLIKLISNYLAIIFLTITAPFHFMVASLPGRQSMATDWIRNMLCNVLAFPGVMAVFYFINYLLGPLNNSPFQVSTQATVTGTTTLPLLGGMDLSFIRVLLAFGALVALPSIPDIICRAVGKVEQYGQMIGQEIGGGVRQGQQYAGQAGEAPRRIAGDMGQLGGLRNQRQAILDAGGNIIEIRQTEGLAGRARRMGT